jgi:hypothetical protein
MASPPVGKGRNESLDHLNRHEAGKMPTEAANAVWNRAYFYVTAMKPDRIPSGIPM